MKTGHIEGKLTMLTRLDELLVSYDVTPCRDERRTS
ncbi:Uncharacterised protein [Aeromonas encheleia]|jgi:hypothetical protein|nr:Uncharacterised protein [Aeromonas encheleia]